jgi:hypothetical protein
MKKELCLLSIACCVTFVNRASAQEAPASGSNAPAPRVGFQMGLRTGYQLPMGKATDGPGGSMSDGFGGQVPLFIEIGGKIVPNIFIGGYLGFGFGGTAGQVATVCKTPGVSCAAVDVRFGAEVQYHIMPGEMTNPWVGYGIGFESIGLGMSTGGQTYSSSDSGIEFAHFMGGVDFRLSRVFGIGPFVDFSIGQYSHYHAELPGLPTQDGSIERTAMHEWLALGARGVFFP